MSGKTTMSIPFPPAVQYTLRELTQTACFAISAMDLHGNNMCPELRLVSLCHPGLTASIDWNPPHDEAVKHKAVKLSEAAVNDTPAMMATAIRLFMRDDYIPIYAITHNDGGLFMDCVNFRKMSTVEIGGEQHPILIRIQLRYNDPQGQEKLTQALSKYPALKPLKLK
jgi:hypothetical protein